MEIIINRRVTTEYGEHLEFSSIEYSAEEYIMRLYSNIKGLKGKELKEWVFKIASNMHTDLLIGYCSLNEYRKVIKWIIYYANNFVEFTQKDFDWLIKYINE